MDPKKLLGRQNFWVQIIFWIKKRFRILKCFGLKVCMKKVLDFRKLRFESFCYNTVLGLNNILENPSDTFQTPSRHLPYIPEEHQTQRRVIRLGGWVGGWGSINNTASLRLHLASWNLLEFQLSWNPRWSREWQYQEVTVFWRNLLVGYSIIFSP